MKSDYYLKVRLFTARTNIPESIQDINMCNVECCVTIGAITIN